MKHILTGFIAFFTFTVFAQPGTPPPAEWPYNMPIWGKKATERGYKIQLPYGLNANYVYNRMDLEISELGVSIGDDPTSGLNQVLAEYVTLDNLNFTNTIARTNGLSVRADAWIFPFWNFYGIYSNNNGTTEVSMQPEWFDSEGNLVLSLPEIQSIVNFSANTWGFGSTFVGKFYEDYFFALDGNITWSQSELLNDAAVLTVISGRVGERFELKNGHLLSLYVGGMYRGFIDQQGNLGAIAIQQALPNIGSNVFPVIDEKVQANLDEIATLNPNRPVDAARIAILEAQNEILYGIEDSFTSVIESDVNYAIKKEIINNWSVQFGFNWEIDPKLTIRGEFGKGNGNDFVMTGVQYRFGLKRVK